jgi:hypothetical protein
MNSVTALLLAAALASTAGTTCYAYNHGDYSMESLIFLIMYGFTLTFLWVALGSVMFTFFDSLTKDASYISAYGGVVIEIVWIFIIQYLIHNPSRKGVVRVK